MIIGEDIFYYFAHFFGKKFYPSFPNFLHYCGENRVFQNV